MCVNEENNKTEKIADFVRKGIMAELKVVWIISFTIHLKSMLLFPLVIFLNTQKQTTSNISEKF